MSEIIMNEAKVWIGNLEKYNEGDLVGRWIELPINEDDLEKVLESIGVDNEEIFIADYDLPFDSKELGEYTPIERLNEIVERYNDLEEGDKYIFNIITDGLSLDKAFDVVKNDDYVTYLNCDDMTDVAHEYVEETRLLDDVPETISPYFDYELFGRDMERECHFIKFNGGYVWILD